LLDGAGSYWDLTNLTANVPNSVFTENGEYLDDLSEDYYATKTYTDIKTKYVKASGASPSYYFASIYAQMGETATAFEWLEQAYKDYELFMSMIKGEPMFKPLYGSPHWQVMLEKVGVPE
jgi:hypothetical protein